jgi:hypothetical protein
MIDTIRTESRTLSDRLAKGRIWLQAHPEDVRLQTAEDTCGVCAGEDCTLHGWLLGAQRAEDKWHALTATGGRVLALFCALSLAHRLDMRLLAGDALLREQEARHGDDEDGAKIVEEMATLQRLREGAIGRIQEAEGRG